MRSPARGLLAWAASRVAARAGGLLLAAAVRLLGALRPAAKPLHPRGRLVEGTLRRTGAVPGTGVPFLDEPGAHRVWARESRAVGLPRPLPDVHGLALRVHHDGAVSDVLLASTGHGRLGRFVLTVSRDPWARPMGTLLPYRTPAGPVLLGARRVGEGRVELCCAVGLGPWRRFADLELPVEPVAGEAPGEGGDARDGRGDDRVSFDPVLHPVPGLEQYAAVALLRGPAYRTARRQRRRQRRQRQGSRPTLARPWRSPGP